MTVVRLSANDMAGFAAADSKQPYIAKLNQLQVEYARERGGLVLEVWQLHEGRLFGKPWMMTLDEVAKRLNVPVSDVQLAADELRAEVSRRWKSTPEYRDSPYARGR